MAKELSEYIDKIALSSDAEEWFLTGVKQINLFIGPNNSGKSRAIRELFSSENQNWSIEKNPLTVNEILDEFISLLLSDVNYAYNVERSVNFKLYDNGSREANIVHADKPIPLGRIAEHLLTGNLNVGNLQRLYIDPIIEKLDPESNIRNIPPPNESIYIPTLRSLRNLGEKDIFSEVTSIDYFKNTLKSKKSIFTGHSLYMVLQENLLGSHAERLKVRKYEEYLSENFFFGKDISLVPRIKDSVVYFKEGEKEERPIYDLGDGIQSIIILTFPVFMAEEPTLFYIEEPEHYLHAGLQRTLIETFAKHKEHLFFMTTHSNHFLDLAQERSDISIQQVSNNEKGTAIKAAKEYETLLNDLGVRASSVLLANSSIWVEGVTDKLYLRTYMKKYVSELENDGNIDKANKLKSYHENLHYVFTEYQGSNITHWDFEETSTENGTSGDTTPARKITKNILLIADADIDGKGNRVKKLSGELGANFHLLSWKEIENYIPYNVLIETAKRRWETFTQTADCSIGRFMNIAEEKFESETRGIGDILEKYVDKDPKLKRNFYKDNSGTIKDKVKFCNTAIEIMSDPAYSWKLTPELTALCKKLWKHIEDSN